MKLYCYTIVTLSDHVDIYLGHLNTSKRTRTGQSTVEAYENGPLKEELKEANSELDQKFFVSLQYGLDVSVNKSYYELQSRIHAAENNFSMGQYNNLGLVAAYKQMEDRYPDGPPGDALIALSAACKYLTLL